MYQTPIGRDDRSKYVESLLAPGEVVQWSGHPNVQHKYLKISASLTQMLAASVALGFFVHHTPLPIIVLITGVLSGVVLWTQLRLSDQDNYILTNRRFLVAQRGRIRDWPVEKVKGSRRFFDILTVYIGLFPTYIYWLDDAKEAQSKFENVNSSL